MDINFKANSLVLYLRLFLLNQPFLSLFEGKTDRNHVDHLDDSETSKCSVKLAQSMIWIASSRRLRLLLHVPGDIVGHGQRRRAGEEACGRGADFNRVRLQPHLLVVVQLADDNAAEVFVVSVTVVQELADLGGARGLVHHQFVILAHQHGAGQQGVQALVQTGLRHLGDDLLTPRRDPLGDWAMRGRGVLQGRRVIRCRRGEGGRDSNVGKTIKTFHFI